MDKADFIVVIIEVAPEAQTNDDRQLGRWIGEAVAKHLSRFGEVEFKFLYIQIF